MPVALMILLVMAACGQQEVSGPQPVTGVEGVVVSSLDESPFEVYEGEQFSLVYEIENRGGVDVTRDDPGRLYVTLDPLYLEEQDSVSQFPENAFWLTGRTPYVDGELSFVTLYFAAREIERFSSRVSTQVLLTACYPYRTISTEQVCIEQMRRVDEGAMICRNTALRPVPPGAPVAVTEIVTRSMHLADDNSGIAIPSFRITIENLGRGVPSTTACDDRQDAGLNNVQIRAWLLDTPLECDSEELPTGYRLRFSGLKAATTCRFPDDVDVTQFDNQANFISLLTVELEYYYRDSARTNVVVMQR